MLGIYQIYVCGTLTDKLQGAQLPNQQTLRHYDKDPKNTKFNFDYFIDRLLVSLQNNTKN